ncbi:MAG TPA: hypothetical protein VH442_08190 [Micromonosporaceae bacterium]
MNLDNLEQDVRDSLLANAEGAPDGAGMLDVVRTRSRRLRTRHRATVAGIAAAVAVAAAIGTPFVLTGVRHTAGTSTNVGAPKTTVPAITATSPPASPSHATRVPLDAAAFTPVTFPMTPTFTPPGLPAPTEGKTVGQTRLVYAAATGNKFLIATVSVDFPPVDHTGATHKSITINGHSATLYTGSIDGAQGVLVVWQLHGKYVSVQASGVSSAQVQQYAKGLADHPRTPGALPFKLTLAPHGYQVAFQEIHSELSPTEFYFNLSAPGQLGNQATDDAVGVVSTADIAKQATGTSITVGGFPAKIDHNSDGQITVYVLRPGFNYAVHEPQNGPLSDDDLIRFAAGVSPTS